MASTSCDWYDLPCNLSALMAWAKDLVLWVPKKIFSALMDGLASIIEAFPHLSASDTFIQNAGTAFGNAGYLADVFALKAGIGMIATALLLRFILRRIPFIG